MYPLFKRAIDIAFALLGLVILSPVLVALGAWVATSSPGGPFYSGVRIGRGGAPFRMLKFRTMVTDPHQIGASSTAADDPRVTTVGRLLRRFKLDELPQLLNVFAGDMSFVGPRPQVKWAVDLYTVEEQRLLSVRPGITDYASLRFRNEGEILKGSTDPDRDYLEKIAPEKIRLGLYYVHNYSFLTDAKIVVATLLSLAGVDPAWCLPTLSSATELA